jgi:SHS family lactate transporter-like MFS transporter
MAGILQASWGIGALLSSLAYALLYDVIGWRGLLVIGVLPALAVVYIRRYVKEPEIWAQNRAIQRTQQREVRAPLFNIFKPGMLANTLNACWWMASGFVVAYSIGSLFPTHLQKDLGLPPAAVALPVMVQSFLFFCSGFLWGWVADNVGRKWALILPAIGGIIVAPFYLFTVDYTMIVIFFGIQGMFAAGGMYATNPSYLSERFPTEVRATAAGFCYHQGAIFGGLTAPVIAYFASAYHLGFVIPMAIGTFAGSVSFIIAMLLGPETRGKHLTADLGVAVVGD